MLGLKILSTPLPLFPYILCPDLSHNLPAFLGHGTLVCVFVLTCCRNSAMDINSGLNDEKWLIEDFSA